MLYTKILKHIICLLLMFTPSIAAQAQDNSAVILGEQINISSASGGAPDSSSPASNVLDNDFRYSSRFSTRENPNDLFLDLGEIWTLEDVKIAWTLGDTRTYDFEIATRISEGQVWSTVYSGRSSGTTRLFDTIDVADSNARFIRIRGFSNSIGSAYTTMTEVQAFGSTVPQEEQDALIREEEERQAQEEREAEELEEELSRELNIISASGGAPDGGSPASNVLDDDFRYSSRFSTRENPNDLFLDLDEISRVEEVKIAWTLGDTRTYEFEVATRVIETQDWTTIFEGQSSGTTRLFDTVDVTDSNAQFIRIRGLSNSLGSASTSMTEVQALGSSVPQDEQDALIADIQEELERQAQEEQEAEQELNRELNIISASGGAPSSSSSPASNVLDNDFRYSSRFSTRENPNDLLLNLGQISSVEDVKIAWTLGDTRTYEFEVATRVTESQDWTTVFAGQSSGTTRLFDTVDVTDSHAQFIRIRGLSNSIGSAYMTMTEVRALGSSLSAEEQDALIQEIREEEERQAEEERRAQEERETEEQTPSDGGTGGLPTDLPGDEDTSPEDELPAEDDTAQAMTLEHFGEPITLVGANIPWSTDSGFSSDFGWYSPLNIDAYSERFDQLEAVGANSARVWLHTTSQVTPDINENSRVTGLSHISSNEVVVNQLRSVLDEAWERGIVVTYSLFSFNMFCDTYGNDFGYNGVEQMQRHRIMVEQNYDSYIDNALLPIVNGLKDHPGLFAYEVFNEPEGAIIDMTDAGHFCPDDANIPGDGLTYPPSLEGVQRFVNRIAAAIHQADPNVKVTTSTHTDFFDSFSNQTLLSQPGADENGTLDFYELHFYPFYLHPPYTTDVSVYNSDRPIVIGEYGAEDVQQESLFQVTPREAITEIIDRGYAGAWPWSLLNNQFGGIEEAIANVPNSDKAIDRQAVEACIQSRDSLCYKQ